MNQLGATARDYFRDFLPTRYSALSDPNEHFSQLGEELENAVVTLAPQIAGQDPAGESYLDKVGRLNAARQQATEIVLREQLYEPNPPEESASPDETAGPDQDLDVGETLQELRTIAGEAWRPDSQG